MLFDQVLFLVVIERKHGDLLVQDSLQTDVFVVVRQEELSVAHELVESFELLGDVVLVVVPVS